MAQEVDENKRVVEFLLGEISGSRLFRPAAQVQLVITFDDMVKLLVKTYKWGRSEAAAELHPTPHTQEDERGDYMEFEKEKEKEKEDG